LHARPETALTRSGGAAAGQRRGSGEATRPLEEFGTGRPRVGRRAVDDTWRRHALAPPAADGVRYPLHPACEQVGGRGKPIRGLTTHGVASAGLVKGPERRRLRGLSQQVRRTKIKLTRRRGRVVGSAVCSSRSQELVSRRDRRSEIVWRGRLAPLLGRFLLCPLLLALPRALALRRPAAILAACGRGSRSTWQIIVNLRLQRRLAACAQKRWGMVADEAGGESRARRTTRRAGAPHSDVECACRFPHGAGGSTPLERMHPLRYDACKSGPCIITLRLPGITARPHACTQGAVCSNLDYQPSPSRPSALRMAPAGGLCDSLTTPKRS
jgi:hypothetical protein